MLRASACIYFTWVRKSVETSKEREEREEGINAARAALRAAALAYAKAVQVIGG